METKITKNMMISEVISNHPQAVKVMQDKGIHCVGCAVATWETIEQAAQSNKVDIKSLIEEINKVVK